MGGLDSLSELVTAWLDGLLTARALPAVNCNKSLYSRAEGIGDQTVRDRQKREKRERLTHCSEALIDLEEQS